jgi:hypothetical protein
MAYLLTSEICINQIYARFTPAVLGFIDILHHLGTNALMMNAGRSPFPVLGLGHCAPRQAARRAGQSRHSLLRWECDSSRPGQPCPLLITSG